MNIIGLRRGPSANSGLPRSAVLNTQDEQLVAQGLPPYTEMSRRNRGWQVMNTSAVAGLVVRPSTTAHATLYNNNTSASEIALVIDRVFVFNLVTTAAISGYSLWGCVHPTGRAADAADITAFKSMSGLATAYAGGARFDNGATVTDDGWFPLGEPRLTGGVTTAPSGAMAIDVEGRIIVPPTAAFSLAPVSTIVGLTFTVGFSFYELPLPMGE